MRQTLHELLNKPLSDRDSASIVSIAHWASYHLVSTIIDQLPIRDQLQHRNHRGVKNSLKDKQVQTIIGNYATRVLDSCNQLETNFMTKIQYGSIDIVPDYESLIRILNDLEYICKKVTEEVNKIREKKK